MIPLWMFPMANACGNSMLLKPSEKDPGAVMLLMELLNQAGLPPGVTNVVRGEGRRSAAVAPPMPTHRPLSNAGARLQADRRLPVRRPAHQDRLLRRVEPGESRGGGGAGERSCFGGDAVLFAVACPQAGEYIHARGSKNGKRVQSNLGAKNHATILPDADKEATLNALTAAAFGAAGQRCMALSVAVFVGDTIKWLPELAERARKLKVRPPGQGRGALTPGGRGS